MRREKVRRKGKCGGSFHELQDQEERVLIVKADRESASIVKDE